MSQLDPSLVVVVTVTKSSASIDRQGFATPLGVFQVDVATQANRVVTYANTQAMIDAGFLATDPAVLWATVVKGQNPAPPRFAIGRRVPGTAQVDTVTITLADAGTWSITINGNVYSYIATASDTVDTIAAGLKAAVDASTEPVVTGTVASGAFTVTAFIAGEAFTNGGIVTGGAGTGTFVNTVANVAAEAIATTLAAILAEDATTWYLFTIETRNDADITAADTFVTPLRKMFFGQTADPDARSGTTPNIIDTIAALNNPRTTLGWKSDDRHFMDAGMASKIAGFDLDQAGGSGTLMGKQLTGVPTDDLSEAEVTNIAGDGENNAGFGGNVYVEISGRGVLLWGRTTEGEFVDVQQAIDWTFFRVTEEVFGSIATTPTKIPYTNAGIATIKNDVRGVLNRGITGGQFSADDPNFPSVTAPDVLTVPDTDKNTRVLRNVVGVAKLAGAIHKPFISITVVP